MDYLIHHMLQKSAKRAPEKEALVHGTQRLNYGEVAKLTSGLAQGLRNAGLRRGERIGIYLEPSISQVVSIFSVSQAEGVFVPINATLFPEQVSHIARDCGMKALITTRAKLASLATVIKDIPCLQFVVLTSEGQAPEVSFPVYNFEQLCEPPSTRPTREEAISKDLAAILYTSGSTGKPKGVMLSHANVMAGSAIVFNSYLEISEANEFSPFYPSVSMPG